MYASFLLYEENILDQLISRYRVSKKTGELKLAMLSLLLSPVLFGTASANVLTRDNFVLPVASHKIDMQAAQSDGGERGVLHLALKPAPAAKISEAQASKIGLKAVPGKVTGIKIETKYGKQVYAVEIMEKSGKETDVFVEVNTGEVLGTD